MLMLLGAAAVVASFLLLYSLHETTAALHETTAALHRLQTVMFKDQEVVHNDDISLCKILAPIPDNLSWIPVPLDERGDFSLGRPNHCQGPTGMGVDLKRCCVGQCRHPRHFIRRDSPAFEGLFVKPDMEGLVSMDTMLEYLHYFVQQKNLERGNNNTDNIHSNEQPPIIDTCVLWFIGDSLSQDQADAAVCKLINLGYEIPKPQACSIDEHRGQYGLRGTCEFTSQTSQYCPKVRVRYDWHDAKFHPLNRIDEAGPVIVNWGVWSNSPEKQFEWMEGFFRTLYNDFSKFSRPDRYAFMWREHEPQHFITKDGTYGGAVTKECGDAGVYKNYRNEAAIDFLQRNNIQIPVIKSFNALRPLHGFHTPGSGDCTHYCFSPWRFDLTWHGVAQGLLQNEAVVRYRCQR